MLKKPTTFSLTLNTKSYFFELRFKSVLLTYLITIG
jgi:hypothetical protein